MVFVPSKYLTFGWYTHCPLLPSRHRGLAKNITVALSGVKSSQALLLSILQSCVPVRKPGFKAKARLGKWLCYQTFYTLTTASFSLTTFEILTHISIYKKTTKKLNMEYLPCTPLRMSCVTTMCDFKRGGAINRYQEVAEITA